MATDALEKRRKSLEEAFFAHREQQLISKLRVALEKEHPRDVLRQLTGIADEPVLDTLVALHVNHETLAAFALYPLVEVAWADGEVDEAERKAFFEAVAAYGIKPGTAGWETLRTFLADTPREEARKAWFAWTRTLKESLSPDERARVRDALLLRARAVAEASGGFLGVGKTISPGEQLVLDRIAEALA